MKQITGTFAILSLPALVHALSGQVVDTNGNPLANVHIEVVGSQQEAFTNNSGRFNLGAGDTALDELHIYAPGYSHQTVKLNSTQSEPLLITLRQSAIEQIDVTATPFHSSIMESAQPVSVLAGDDLRRQQSATLGDTLKNEVGVHSSYFGPVASTPIIRGLNGPRLMITQNSLDTSDASRVGPDHVVAAEASTAEQIEILRGPATLFYGSGAIGGVVNVVDDRVPSSSEVKGAFSVDHSTVNEGNRISGAFTGGGDTFAFHVDGFWRDGEDYEIPGLAELEHDEHEENEEEEHEEHSEGVLESSAAESQGFNFGGCILLENGYVGLSYGRLEIESGIPGHSHGHEEEEEEDSVEEHEEESVISDLEQDRWQLISELAINSAWISSLNTRISYTDYEHSEIENGEVGTTFKNDTIQARVELIAQELNGWHGAILLEGRSSDFEAIGEEAFTTPSRTDNFALAIMEEKHTGQLLWQLGARIEQVTIKADPIEFEDHDTEEVDLLAFDDIKFNPFSLSAGVVWDFAEDFNAAFSFSHAQRAPSAAELFSYGPHIGTGTFEVGALFELHDEEGELHFEFNDDAQEEVSNNIDLSLRKHSGNVGWVVNLFYNQVDNFLYERNTGLTSEDLEHDHEEEAGEEDHEHEELPVYVFDQADAELYGLEAQLNWRVSDPLTLSVWGDSIRGKLSNGSNLPRIPPLRIGSELTFESGGWLAQLGVSRYSEQDKVAVQETTTDGYTLVDAQLAYTFPASNTALTVYLQGDNLTDEDARVHSSFLKDRAPLPGRGFTLGLRGSF